MKTIVVLGGGVSGHTSALFLKRFLGKKHRVVVITPNADWNWIPSNIWVGIGAMNKKLESDPTIFSTVGKKIYFFSNQEAKEMFDKDPKSFIEKADKNWKTLK